MRRLRLICMSIAIFLVLNSVQIFAQNVTTPGGDDALLYESEKIVSALGIFDGINKEGELTRGEFAAIAVRLINVGNAGFTRYYSDVDENTPFANEITQARVHGIASGTADSLFMPSKKVTYIQSLKMIISALGYDSIAEIRGGYPNGYATVARDNDITEGVGIAHDEFVSYRTAVVLIANALRSDVLEVSGMSSDSPDDILHYDKNTSRTVLNRYFGLTLVQGVAWAADVASMRKTAGNEGCIDIEGNVYTSKDADLQQYIGLDVVAGVTNSGKAEFVFASNENTVYEFERANVEFVNSHKVKVCDENDKEKSLSLDADYSSLKNNVLSTQTPSKSGDGYIKFIDNDDDGKIDVVNDIAPEYFVVSSISNDVAFDRNGKQFRNSIAVNLPDEITYMGWETPTIISKEELKPNMVLAVYADDSGNVLFMNACYRIMHGAKVTQLDNYGNIWLDDVKYQSNSYFKNYYTDIRLGQRLTVYFDDTGRICAVDRYVSASADNYVYGYFLAWKQAQGMGLPMMKLLCTDGEKRGFDIKDSILLDGIKVSASGSEMINKFGAPGAPKYQLIRYMTDQEDRIIKIDTLEDREKNGDLDYSYETTSWETDNNLTRFVKMKRTVYRGSGSSFYPYGINGTVAFDVPKALLNQNTGDFDESLFKVRTKGFSDSERVTVDMYDFTSSYQAGAVVAYTTSGGGTSLVEPDGKNDVVLVESVTGVLTDEGDETISINGVLCNTWGSSSRVNYKIAPKMVDSFKAENMVPKAGDMIQVNVDSSGLVDGIRIQRYDIASGTYEIGQVGGYILGDRGFLATKAYTASDSAFAFIPSIKGNEIGDVDSPTDGVYIMPNTNRCQVWVYDFAKETLSSGSAADILSIKNVGEQMASDMIVFLDNALPTVVLVYK